MKRAIVFVVLVICAGLTASLRAADFSPSVFSPDVVQVAPNEACVKESGRLKCRWDGECAKRGTNCMSCTKDMRYQDGLGCYSCPSGTSLKQVNGQWRCIG